VVDAGAAAERPKGHYSAYAPCIKTDLVCTNLPRRGWTRIRAKDGLHFCPAITRATIHLLRHCPVFASGAKRFGLAQARPLKSKLGI